MRKLAVVALCGLVFSMAPMRASAQESGFGLGLIVGDPTGLSGKGWLSDRTAIDFAVGFAFYGGDHLILQADFLWHFPLVSWSRANMLLHVGVGPKLAFFTDDHYYDHHHHDDEVFIGARAPVGLTFTFTRAPVDVFVELALGLWIIQDVDFDLDAAVGARYWF